jgi:ubiquinone biosynthesis protein
LARKDEIKIADALLKLTYSDRAADRSELERDLVEIADQYLYLPMGELEFGRFLQELLEMLTTHGLCLKPTLFLMMKALSTVEGMGRLLDPDFEMIRHAEPFVRQVQLERFHPKRLAGDVFETGAELVSLLREIPAEFRAILKQAREGKVKIEFEHSGLEPVLFTHDRTSNRIAFAIVLASLIIGSSLIVLSGIPPQWQGIPLIGLGGFIVAGLMGFWLLVSILRRGRM